MSDIEKHINLNGEYGKDPNLDRAEVKKLQNWCENNPSLPNYTEFQALAFLHSTNNDYQLSQKTAEKFHQLRSKHSYIFQPIEDEQTIRDTLTSLFMRVLPEKTPEGYDIFMMSIRDPDASTYNFLNIIKLADMIFMSHLYKAGISNGLIILYDLTNLSLKHVFRTHLKMAKDFATYLQEGFPLRLHQVHFISMSAASNTLLTLTKPFLAGKILKILVCHKGDNKTVYEYIPEKILPREVYGCGKTLEELKEGFVESLMEDMPLFKWLENQNSKS